MELSKKTILEFSFKIILFTVFLLKLEFIESFIFKLEISDAFHRGIQRFNNVEFLLQLSSSSSFLNVWECSVYIKWIAELQTWPSPFCKTFLERQKLIYFKRNFFPVGQFITLLKLIQVEFNPNM